MAQRTLQKEGARQARLAAEQATAVRAAQRRRLGALAGVLVVAAVVVTVAIAISTTGARKLGIQTGPTATGTYRAVARELAGIPQNGTTLGTAHATVTVQYFGDLECPYCAELTLGLGGGGLPQLIAGPVRRGQVKLVYRSLETASYSTNNDRWIPQQVAAYAAGRQHLFWDYAELFYHEQGEESTRYVTESYLQGLARQITPLNFRTWMADRTDGAFVRQITADGKRATADALEGTPTLVATGARGSEIIASDSSGVPTYAGIRAAVKAVA